MPLRKPGKGASRKTRRKAASGNIAAEMRSFKAGSKRVKSRNQAIAIGLSAAGLSKPKKRPPKSKRKKPRRH